MAFRILNEEEKLFLNEKQLENYEKELRRYKERLAFVEKIEKIENAEIKKYSPSMRTVGTVDAPEMAPFRNEGIGRIELRKAPKASFDAERFAVESISSTDITGFINASSPIKERISLGKELSGGLSEKIGGLNEFGGRKYSVRKAGKPVVVSKSFDSSSADINVSLVKKPIAQFAPKSFEMPERKPLALTKKTVDPMAAAREFLQPELASVKLSVPRKARTASASFKMPAMNAVKLHVPAKADTLSAEFRLAATGAPSLMKPEIRSFGKKGFDMPSLSKPALRTVSASAPRSRRFSNPEVKIGKRPDIAMPEMKKSSFRKPEVKAGKRPDIAVPELKLSSFNRPDRAQVKLRKRAVPEMLHAEFSMPEMNAPKVNKKGVVRVIAKNFEAPEMPGIRLKINAKAAVPQHNVGNMPDGRANIRKPDIIKVEDTERIKQNLSGIVINNDGITQDGITQEDICAVTEKIRSFDAKSAQDSILSMFKNEYKGTGI